MVFACLTAGAALCGSAIQGLRAWRQAAAAEPGYYRAILVEDQLLFALTADLGTERRASGQAPLPLLQDVLGHAFQAHRARDVPTEVGGWLYQPGMWTDHPDYRYAGQTAEVPGMEPRPVPGIAEDSSHSHGWPLWIASLSAAHLPGSPERRYYEDLRRRLERQFLRRVLVRPSRAFPSYRLTNFMDGWNGVYRWGYPTQGPEDGYGPYELSGTMLLGWWTFLDSPGVRAAYGSQARRFPLPEEAVRLYVGPNTTRERHPLVRLPDSLRNGYLELVTRLAGKVPRPDRRTPGAIRRDARDRALWAATVVPHLEAPLWVPRDAYDAGHHLMVPLHAAFRMRAPEWQDAFTRHVGRLAAHTGDLAPGRLDRLHYLYLLSRFLVLARQAGRADAVPPALEEFLYREVQRFWLEEPAWQWGRQPFPNARERLRWKLGVS